MAHFKLGDKVPENINLSYVPLTDHEESALSCAVPILFDLSKAAKAGKKIVVVSFPGAFTPTCSQVHLPEYLEDANLKSIISKGYDTIIFLAANDPFVLQAFAKAYKIDKDEFKRKHVIFASDVNLEFSKKLGLTLDLTKKGMGERTARYALVIHDDKITYIGSDASGVEDSGYKALSSHL